MTFDQKPSSRVQTINGDSDPINELDGRNAFDQLAARRVAVTLNQFSFLAAVARHGNLTKASADLRVSQPSVSQQLKQLEDRYGAKIYRRVRKGVEITEAGQALLQMINPILEQVARLEMEFKKAGGRSAPEVLTVGGTYSASAYLLPQLLACLGKQHPKAELEFRTNTSEELERLVMSSALDLAVIDRKSSKELKSELLRREEVVVFAPSGHRLVNRARVDLLDLFAEPLIIRGGKGISGNTERRFRELRQQGFPVNIALRCEGPGAVKAAVRQGMGVGVAFEDVIRGEIESGEFKPIKVSGLQLEAKSFIIYSPKRPLSPLAQEFLQLLREARTEALQSKAKPRIQGPEEHTLSAAFRGFAGDTPVHLPVTRVDSPVDQFDSVPAETLNASAPGGTVLPTALLLGFLSQSSAWGFQMLNGF
jgi:DNA-binding transcriptional LysR family regulator